MTHAEAGSASYYAWYPMVESARDVLSILLTAGHHHEAPISGSRFAADVASAAGLTLQPVMFGCDEFATLYFGDAGSEGTRWSECWDMRLMLPEKVRRHSVRTLTRFPVEASPDSAGEVRAQIPCRVIADFDSREMAVDCRKALHDRAYAQSIRWPDRYFIRDLGRRHQQLCIDVATVERSHIDGLLADATVIMTLCQEMGGRTRAPAV